MTSEKLSHIILVDDDSSHRLLSRKALLTLSSKPVITEYADVKNTIEYLAGAPREIHLAVIDFNLGYVKGTMIVEWLRANAHYQKIPVIMISTSHLSSDFHEAYAAGTDCFLYKDETLKTYNENLTKASKYLMGVK